MSDIIIQVDNLSKHYVVGASASRRDGLRHAIESAVRSPFQWLKSRTMRSRDEEREFWALRGVNLSIRRGEVVGFIGRNGAGKSTLLKVLSRITEPTTGRITLHGRVASLLEVGTGFHPELTGRENIFLNGAILGMSRVEIKQKFDEIVAFAEVERFLDTPVKRYSSGMYVRLAFAVAAHLEPEILVVDEVLAVGDAEFQKKCLSKMGDVANAGRTVLFVSHNMQAVARLCSRCVLLHRGQVMMDGESHRVANAYLNSGVTTSAAREWSDLATAPGDAVVRLCATRIRSSEGHSVDTIDVRARAGIELEYEVLTSGYLLLPHFVLRNQDGTVLFVSVDLDPAWRGRRRPAGRYVSVGWIPGNLLTEGMVSVMPVLMSLSPEHIHAMVEDAVAFRVVDDLSTKDTSRGDYNQPMPGLIRPMLTWQTRLVARSEKANPAIVHLGANSAAPANAV